MRACAPLRLGPLAVLGVSLGFAAPALAADTARQVTFSKDVAPILQAKCQECHQPNSIAPMSLITFQDARPWARSIKERVSTRQMPPWHIDRSVGVQKFKNDMSLTDEQVDTIVKWVDQGAQQGDPKDLPAPKPIDTDNIWRAQKDGYGPPDLVIKSPEYTMPAVHQDTWWRPMSDIPITDRAFLSVSFSNSWRTLGTNRRRESSIGRNGLVGRLCAQVLSFGEV